MTSIAFLEPKLSLAHIAPACLPLFLHATLTVLRAGPAFLNLSLTPQGASIVLPTDLARRCFAPAAALLRTDHGFDPATGSAASARTAIGESGANGGVRIVDGYLAMQIDGEGICSGARLLSLTRPLADAGVSILFITTYFSDYVLVAACDEAKVRRTLLSGEFEFEDLSGSFVSRPASSRAATPTKARSPAQSPRVEHAGFDGLRIADDLARASQRHTQQQQQQMASSSRSLDGLRQSNVTAKLHRDTELAMAGLRADLHELIPALTDVLLREEKPQFFSLTAAPETPVSVLLPLSMAGVGPAPIDGANNATKGAFVSRELLLGGLEPLVPLSLDLTSLTDGGLQGCGIVCTAVEALAAHHDAAIAAAAAVAGDRAGETESDELVMSYLSTAVTGNVLLPADDVDRLQLDRGCPVM